MARSIFNDPHETGVKIRQRNHFWPFEERSVAGFCTRDDTRIQGNFRKISVPLLSLAARIGASLHLVAANPIQHILASRHDFSHNKECRRSVVLINV